ncbi:carbamoyl-phosphate synthase large chain 1 domain protein [Clostridioides difficile P19]|nr:hypothetical protein [Clostridioides difficile]EQJ27570.1 carbamoyl-phosphate synthase large chain 1 domain protein [Clostridioides difficile P19]
MAKFLHEKNIPIWERFRDIDAAEDREKFDDLLERLDINRPKGKVYGN